MRFWFDEPLRLQAARVFQHTRLERVRAVWRRQFKGDRDESWSPDLAQLDALLDASTPATDAAPTTPRC